MRVTLKGLAAEAYGASLVAVLLSGASEDGARGLAAVRGRGGQTLVQDPATSPARTMPAAAIRLGAAEHVVSPEGVVAFLSSASEETRCARRPGEGPRR